MAAAEEDIDLIYTTSTRDAADQIIDHIANG
jgi:hypothetical protein